MRPTHLAFASLSLLAACAADPALGGLPFEGEASSADKADAVSLATRPLEVALTADVADRAGHFVFTNESEWRAYAGDVPAGVDFSREWIAVYAAGMQTSGGFVPSIVEVRSDADQAALIVETVLAIPGADCLVTLALEAPYVAVAFDAPSVAPQFALTDHSDEVYRCGLNAEERDALDASRRAWEQARATSNDSYTYGRSFSSFFGNFSSHTDLVVTAGVVSERRFELILPDAELVTWTETGDEVGSHDDSRAADPLTVDQLYDVCQEILETVDPAQNELLFALDDRGLLQSCTYIPNGCQDDCSRGFRIRDLELTPITFP